MSISLSRRRLLLTAGIAASSGLAGCLGDEEIDVEIQNLTETPVDYEMQIGSFDEDGSLESEQSDRYEDVLDQPSSSSQFETDIAFGVAVEGVDEDSQHENENGDEDSQHENENGDEDSQHENGNGDDDPEGFFEAASIDDPVDVNQDVVEISVTYSEFGIVVDPLVEDELDDSG